MSILPRSLINDKRTLLHKRLVPATPTRETLHQQQAERPLRTWATGQVLITPFGVGRVLRAFCPLNEWRYVIEYANARAVRGVSEVTLSENTIRTYHALAAETLAAALAAWGESMREGDL